MRAGERPAAENLLRVLVDINDYDVRIRFYLAGAAKTEAGVEGVEFQALNGLKNGRRGQQNERFLVDEKSENTEDDTNSKRGPVRPPEAREARDFLPKAARAWRRQSSLRGAG